MKLYCKDGVELHKHSSTRGTRYKLYIKGKYYPFPKLTTSLNSKSENTKKYVPLPDETVEKVKYKCTNCGATRMDIKIGEDAMMVCTDCRHHMVLVGVKKKVTVKRGLVRRKGLERF